MTNRKPGNIMSLARADDDELTIEVRRRALREILARWAAWDAEGRKFVQKDLIEGIKVGTRPIMAWSTVTRWVRNQEWARKEYAEFLGVLKLDATDVLRNRFRQAMVQLTEAYEPGSGATWGEKIQAIKLTAELADRWDIFEEGRTATTQTNNFLFMAGAFEGQVAYRQARPEDVVEADYEELENQNGSSSFSEPVPASGSSS